MNIPLTGEGHDRGWKQVAMRLRRRSQTWLSSTCLSHLHHELWFASLQSPLAHPTNLTSIPRASQLPYGTFPPLIYCSPSRTGGFLIANSFEAGSMAREWGTGDGWMLVVMDGGRFLDVKKNTRSGLDMFLGRTGARAKSAVFQYNHRVVCELMMCTHFFRRQPKHYTYSWGFWRAIGHPESAGRPAEGRTVQPG